MIYSEDYVVPRVLGEPYLNKPPLQNWLIILLAGNDADAIGPVPIRLISLMALAGTAACLWSLGRRRKKGWIAVPVFLTMGIRRSVRTVRRAGRPLHLLGRRRSGCLRSRPTERIALARMGPLPDPTCGWNTDQGDRSPLLLSARRVPGMGRQEETTVPGPLVSGRPRDRSRAGPGMADPLHGAQLCSLACRRVDRRDPAADTPRQQSG